VPADGRLFPLLDSQRFRSAQLMEDSNDRRCTFCATLRWFFNGDDGTPDTMLNFAEAANEIMPEYVLGMKVVDYFSILKRPISTGLGQPDRWAFLL
jgi:hypothetical protein